jgi:hypothetical protein
MKTSYRHPTNTEITTRAREIYHASGCQPGHDMDNWLQAEYELRQLPVRASVLYQLTLYNRPAAGILRACGNQHSLWR